MTIKKKFKLGDDLPKKNPWREDRLNYAPFANRLFRAIRNLDAPNGYVIGIQGRWGSGKSTIINFVRSYLDKHNEELGDEAERITFIDFRPWIVAGHQDLMSAFFKVLFESLGVKDGWLKAKWKGFLRAIYGPADNLIDAVAVVGMAVDPTKVGAGFAGAVVKKSINGMIENFLEAPSLQLAYENLKKQLSGSEKRFLVVIDDIDRLKDEEVRSIMQMVKTIGQLPNVVYLLSYDKAIVWAALDDKRLHQGPRYAEKIIQQEIELPRPSRQALLGMLEGEIRSVIGGTESSTRWQYIILHGLHRWIRSPRDVVRASNAVIFAWSALEGEIDPQDLLAMEGLRLFDEATFNWLRDNRDFLFSEGRFILGADEQKREVVENLKRRYESRDDLPQVLQLLSVLFPGTAKWFGRVGGEIHNEVVKRRGIGCTQGYDTYFGLHPSSDAIAKTVIDGVMQNLEDEEALTRLFRSYLGKFNSRNEPLIGLLLDEINIRYQGSRPARPTQELLGALFAIGEEVLSTDYEPGMLLLSPRARIGFLINNLLKAWGEQEAGPHLVEAFKKSDSPAFCSDVYVDRGRDLGVFESDSPDRPTIFTKDFESLGLILLAKIEMAVNDGSLKDAPFYFDIVRSWAHLSEPAPVKRWLMAGVHESADFMVKAAKGLVSYSIGTPVRRYTMRESPDVELFDVAVLAEAGRKHLGAAKLSDDERRLITTVVKGCERIIEGEASSTIDELLDDEL